MARALVVEDGAGPSRTACPRLRLRMRGSAGMGDAFAMSLAGAARA